MITIVNRLIFAEFVKREKVVDKYYNGSRKDK